jgi:hypothetical protein
MIKTWHPNDVIRQIHAMKWAATDPRMDGFVTWPIKQELYKIKWEIDSALANCPKYAGEEEFLEEHNKQVMWNTLNEKTNR